MTGMDARMNCFFLLIIHIVDIIAICMAKDSLNIFWWFVTATWPYTAIGGSVEMKRSHMLCIQCTAIPTTTEHRGQGHLHCPRGVKIALVKLECNRGNTRSDNFATAVVIWLCYGEDGPHLFTLQICSLTAILTYNYNIWESVLGNLKLKFARRIHMSTFKMASGGGLVGTYIHMCPQAGVTWKLLYGISQIGRNGNRRNRHRNCAQNRDLCSACSGIHMMSMWQHLILLCVYPTHPPVSTALGASIRTDLLTGSPSFETQLIDLFGDCKINSLIVQSNSKKFFNWDTKFKIKALIELLNYKCWLR